MRYTKRPVTIDAIQFDGTNIHDIAMFVGEDEVLGREEDKRIYIMTSKGSLEVNKGEWVIRGVKGEFYPCAADVFEMTYTPARDIPKLNAQTERALLDLRSAVMWLEDLEKNGPVESTRVDIPLEQSEMPRDQW